MYHVYVFLFTILLSYVATYTSRSLYMSVSSHPRGSHWVSQKTINIRVLEAHGLQISWQLVFRTVQLNVFMIDFSMTQAKRWPGVRRNKFS